MSVAGSVEFDPQLLSRYDLSGPRYTSYPTAPNFRPEFDAPAYRRVALASNDDPIPRPLSIYVHVPFCRSPCFYCGCNRVVTRDRSRAARYLEHLLREIELQAELFDRDRKVLQLHLGGGTPNYLDVDQLGRLMDKLREHFKLARGDEREFSTEIDPRYADAAYIEALAKLGFNRMSCGVQDFDPAVQEAVNRLQSVEQTVGVIDAARRNGFKSVSVDLIYGLPKQTAAGFSRTLDTVIGVRPDRIAVYSYAHLPHLFRPQRQIAEADLPAPVDKLGLLGLAIEKLCGAGYVYIGMDHFALPEDELVKAREQRSLQRNFQGYSTHAECDLIGLGVSAIGHVGDAFVQNLRDVASYDTALDRGQLPVARGLELSEDDRLRAEIIQSLMCDGVLELEEFERVHDIDFEARFSLEMKRMRELERDGLVETRDRCISVTPRGRLLVRIVAMAFDAYLARPTETVTRFSRVI
jgi:oxygen-independent coproporphyrinogen-3 oxidase